MSRVPDRKQRGTLRKLQEAHTPQTKNFRGKKGGGRNRGQESAQGSPGCSAYNVARTYRRIFQTACDQMCLSGRLPLWQHGDGSKGRMLEAGRPGER